jgi:DNA-binding GntR family transcriptional regulator
VEFARQRLRGAILSGQFAPGALMKQTELADALEVGRTPLREAIRVVQEEGLLVSEPNRTVRVAGFSAEDLEGLYALRIVHEAAMVRITIPDLSPEDVGELRALMVKMEHFAGEEDFDRYSVPHRAFHTLLVAGHGARALALSSVFFDHSARYVRAYAVSGPGRYDLADQEHRAILEGAVDRDASRCAREIVAHYVRTAAGVIEQLDPEAELPRLQVATAIALGEPNGKASAALWKHAREQHRRLSDAR